MCTVPALSTIPIDPLIPLSRRICSSLWNCLRESFLREANFTHALRISSPRPTILVSTSLGFGSRPPPENGDQPNALTVQMRVGCRFSEVGTAHHFPVQLVFLGTRLADRAARSGTFLSHRHRVNLSPSEFHQQSDLLCRVVTGIEIESCLHSLAQPTPK